MKGLNSVLKRHLKEAQDAEAAEPAAGGREAAVPVHLLLDDDGRHVGRRRHLRHRHRLQTLHHRAAVQPPGKFVQMR